MTKVRRYCSQCPNTQIQLAAWLGQATAHVNSQVYDLLGNEAPIKRITFFLVQQQKEVKLKLKLKN